LIEKCGRVESHNENRRTHLARYQRETSISKMERPMKKPKLPRIDFIQQLADFWDSHNLTDFEEELEDGAEPVFDNGTTIKVSLESLQVEAVERMARAKGVSREELVRAWVLQKLDRQNRARPANH
jgi:Ribbon-helix-helix protein, copG family